MLRLSLALGATPTELEDRLTARDLASYQALVEIDGPWWPEHTAAHLRQLCSVQAGAWGADVPPDRFRVDWRVGPARAAAADEFIDLGDEGLRIFARSHGLSVKETTA